MDAANAVPQRRLILVPVVSRFLHWFAAGLIMPVINLLQLSKGIALEQIGLIAGIYSITVVLLELPTGILSDLIGRKKIYQLALVFSMAGYCILLLGHGFLPVLAGFALYGVSRALSSGSIESVFIDQYIDIAGKDRLHKLITAMNTAEASGLAAGSLLGGMLPVVTSRLFPSTNMYSGNIVLQLAVMAALFVFTAVMVREKRIGQDGTRRQLLPFLRESFTYVRTNRIVINLLLATVFWGVCFAAIETYWQPQVKSILGSDKDTWIFGLLATGYFLAAVLGNAVVSPLMAKTKLSSFGWMIIFRVMISALIVVLALQTGIAGFGVFYLLMFMFNGMSSPPESTAFNAEVPGDKRSSMLSLQSLFLQIGGAVASAVYSLLLLRLTIPAIWVITAIVFGLSSLLYIKPMLLKSNSQTEGKGSYWISD